MKQIKIIASGKHLPEKRVENQELEKKFNLDSDYIEKRTGIKVRYYTEKETIEELAIKATKDMLKKNKNIDKQSIDMIIVATTTPENYMPGIANKIQKELQIKECNAYDILAGCNGFITAFDIASTYIQTNRAKRILVVGVDILSKYTNPEDIGTAIILSDGAGAVLLEGTEEEKIYSSYITSREDNNEILKCNKNEYIFMNGKEIYKYAVTEPVKHIKKLLEKTHTELEEIKYIIPHQSNKRIMTAIANRLKIDLSKIYINIENKGNTFCASIPIAIDQMLENKLIEKGNKVLLLGYGGGLNTGVILLEI